MGLGLGLGGQRVACAVKVAEGAAQPARVALPPIDRVEADFAQQPVRCKVQVELLRRQHDLVRVRR